MKNIWKIYWQRLFIESMTVDNIDNRLQDILSSLWIVKNKISVDSQINSGMSSCFCWDWVVDLESSEDNYFLGYFSIQGVCVSVCMCVEVGVVV